MSTFTTPRGIHIPQASSLKENYEIKLREDKQFSILANISAEKIDPVFRAAILRLQEPVFLILETPCNQAREVELGRGPTCPFHKDVYFMDGQSNRQLMQIYERFQEILIHDGLVSFGVGSHESGEEVFVGKYKIFSFFSRSPEKFEDLLAEFGISKTDQLVTAWKTFTREAPGKVSRHVANGIDIYGMVEDLMRNHGLYHSKTVEG